MGSRKDRIKTPIETNAEMINNENEETLSKMDFNFLTFQSSMMENSMIDFIGFVNRIIENFH